MVDVSIIIVSMNNLKVLRPCLDSIRQYTSCSYEVLVVAYLYSDENLQVLKNLYPWIKIIESNVIRGFAENNNLALRQACGRYCFVVNDDTFINDNVIDKLVRTLDRMDDDVVILSPNIKYPDGRDQICGRRRYTWLTWIYAIFSLDLLYYPKSKYEDKQGVFQTYNISGAAFLIKTDIFRKEGWFDEIFFFCPEDIALSDSLNKKGYKCYVDADNVLYHIGSGTASKTQMATMPAHYKGGLIYYSHGSKFLRYFLASIIFIVRLVFSLLHGIIGLSGSKRHKILYRGSLNVCRTIFSDLTPKQIFIKFYRK